MTRIQPANRSDLRAAAVFLLAAWAAGCVPIQLARFAQIEAYEIALDPPRDRVDEVFTGLIGRSNWLNLKGRYGVDELLEDPQRIKIYGRTTVVFYPVSRDEVLVEGTGRFFVVDEHPGVGEPRVLLSGDSFVGPTRLDLKGAKKTKTIEQDLKFSYFVTRIPARQNYYSHGRGDTTVRIRLDKREGTRRSFSVNYEADYEVLVSLESGDKERVGTLRFRHGDADKRFDLSGGRWIRGIGS